MRPLFPIMIFRDTGCMIHDTGDRIQNWHHSIFPLFLYLSLLLPITFLPFTAHHFFTSYALRFFLKLKSHRIDTIPLARWRRTIIKHMPQMGITHGTGNFNTPHAITGIISLVQMFGIYGLRKTGPARSGIKLDSRIKKRCPAAYTFINALFMMMHILPR
jgi:hypothetical protein